MAAPRYGPDLAFVHDAGHSGFGRAAAPGLLALLEAAGLRRAHVVELGCGSGAATRALVGAGHRVTAIDASRAMLRLARRRAPGARFVRAALPGAAIPRCDAVVAVGEVLNYLASPADLDRVLRRAHAALAPGGVLAFDVREPSNAREPVLRGKVARDWVVTATSVERRGRLVRSITTFRRVGGRWRRTDEVHRLTLFTVADLLRRLRRAGFAPRARRGYGRVRLGSGFAVLVARKPGARLPSRRRRDARGEGRTR